MLLRVRTNVGTWKFELDPLDTITTLSQKIGPEWKLTLPLSKDPNGEQPLAKEQSLKALGIHHGDMIYCRVEAILGDNHNGSISNNDGAALPVAQRPLVIDLVDSSSSDDENDKDTQSQQEEPPSVPTTKRRRATTSPKKGSSISTATTTRKKGSLSPETVMASSDSMTHPSKFQIASYNVWFGPPDPSAQQVYPKHRMDAIAQELASCTSSGGGEGLVFIGFQELTDTLVDYLTPHMKQMGFRFCMQPRQGNWYGVGLALQKKYPIVESKFLPYSNSCQGRGLLYIQTPTMLLATTHLESFMDPKTYDGAKEREEQIVEATTFCEHRLQENPQLQLAVIVGDFNWDDERYKAPNRPLLQVVAQGRDWNDAGTPRDYTYDAKENPMLGGMLRRRLDRCIYLTQNKKETTTTTHLKKLGMTAIPNLTWNKKNPFNGTTRTVPVAPSDHFGLAITFAMESKKG